MVVFGGGQLFGGADIRERDTRPTFEPVVQEKLLYATATSRLDATRARARRRCSNKCFFLFLSLSLPRPRHALAHSLMSLYSTATLALRPPVGLMPVVSKQASIKRAGGRADRRERRELAYA